MPTTFLNRKFPRTRLRRMRQQAFSRELMAETQLTVKDFIYPVFLIEGKKNREIISSMPGIERLTLDYLLQEAAEIVELGIPAIALFPLISNTLKSNKAEEAYNPNGLIQQAIVELKKNYPELGIITDIALDPYTSHGQDGLIDPYGIILNDETVETLVKQALSHAKAGADIVAPSGMMDGQIKKIRAAFEKENLIHTKILAYSAKYASALYGPFRDAVGSKKTLGNADKKTYQMDIRNSDEALHEIALDISEGADMVMVKPGIFYNDVLYRVKEMFKMPTFIYQVSGEYAMIKAAGQKEWIDEKNVMMESLFCLKRAGADAILTYFAKDAAKIMKEQLFPL